MSKQLDDLEAVRQVVATLEAFPDPDRERILRWAREKLGMHAASSKEVVGPPSEIEVPGIPPPERSYPPAGNAPSTDIKSFVSQKDPKNGTQLAAVVAYYHQFQAPASERRDAITKEDLTEACRKAERERPARPAQTLVNAYADGVLDKMDRGRYRINSVGENLVAMVLPASADSKPPRRASKKAAARKPTKGARKDASAGKSAKPRVRKAK